jgi:hypothetical protein
MLKEKTGREKRQVERFVKPPKELIDAFEQAMRQWYTYSTDLSRCDMNERNDLEAIKYRECADVLKKYKAV